METEFGDAIISTEATSALEAQERAQLDVQITTAKRFPRSVSKFQENAMSLATINEDVAAGCFYEMPRGGKSISGPSVRLAEIVMSEWGNAHAAARVIEIGARTITAQAVFRDLEKNTAVSMEVTRRITDRNGDRYSDDMITVTGNAACKIAYRNAVFTGVPRAFWSEVYERARLASIGNASNMGEAIAKMLQYFANMGKREKHVLALLDRYSTEEITKEDLIMLKGVATAIREGEISVEEAFRPAGYDDAPVTSVTPDDIGSAAKKKAESSEPFMKPPAEQKPPVSNAQARREARQRGELHESEVDESAEDGAESSPPPAQQDEPEPQQSAEPEPAPADDETEDDQPEPAPAAKPKEDNRAADSKDFLLLNELAMDAGMRPSALGKWSIDNFGVSPDRLNRTQMARALTLMRKEAGNE